MLEVHNVQGVFLVEGVYGRMLTFFSNRTNDFHKNAVFEQVILQVEEAFTIQRFNTVLDEFINAENFGEVLGDTLCESLRNILHSISFPRTVHNIIKSTPIPQFNGI